MEGWISYQTRVRVGFKFQGCQTIGLHDMRCGKPLREPVLDIGSRMAYLL